LENFSLLLQPHLRFKAGFILFKKGDFLFEEKLERKNLEGDWQENVPLN
jgi:hypothetical protein